MSKLRILFVDDETHILDGLKRMFHKQRNEWEMTFINDPHEALSAVERSPFDVVVTDMRMPGMSGAELLDEIIKIEPNILRIVLSGQSDRETIFESVKVAHQYLSKPCDTETLKSAIARACTLQEIVLDDNLKRLLSQLSSLPSLPSLYTKIMEEIQKPVASIDAVGEIISQDLAMSAKILQLANSAFFGFSQHVSSPTRAVIILGLDTIKALALSIKVFSKFDQVWLKGISLNSLWHHSMATGIFAQRIVIAEKGEKKTADYAFMAGLLHDLGKLVLASNLPGRFEAALTLSVNEGISIVEAEREVFGTTHAEVCAYMIGLWGLPDPIIEAIALHHSPERSRSKEFTPLTAVHVADVLEYEKGRDNDADDEYIVEDTYLSELGLLERLPKWREITMGQTGEEEND